MRKLFSFFVAFLLSATSYAAVSYELNGGVTNADNWQTKNDMFQACMAECGVTGLATLDELKADADPFTKICGKLTDVSGMLNAEKWNWLEAYIISVQNVDAAATPLVEGTTSAGWRYAIAAFFLESKRGSWPVSADFSVAGKVEVFQPSWKQGFANPTEPTAEFVLNAPYKDGYDFAGWYTTANFSGNKVTKIDTFTTGKLYAKWNIRIQSDGLYYKIVDDFSHTLELIYHDAYSSSNYITTISIPKNITHNGITYSVTSIGNSAFWSCSSLTSITIPNSVTSIGYNAFRNCSSLTSITIPNSVTSIGYSAFYYCSSLTSVIIPNSVTSIGYSAFRNCSSLTSITIPNSVTSIGNSAFANCSSLTSITIPNSVTSIGNSAFWSCSSLTSITIPNSVTSIGYCAFYDCSGLTSVTSLAEVPPTLGSSAFYNVSTQIPVYVPSGSVSAYQSAEGWKLFTNIQEQIITYELNGGVTNDDNWLSKADMWAAFSTDAGISVGTYEEVKAAGDPFTLICGKLLDANVTTIMGMEKWDWLEAYIMQVQNADANATALVEGHSSAGWRYALAAFFIEGHRSAWPKSTDFAVAGTVEAFQKAWKHGFANPTEPTAEFVLNAPYKEGYTFDGWYAAADFSGDKVTTVNAETTGTLYAKWVEYIPTIAEVRALADDTETKVAGVVNHIDGKNIYIQDATAGILVYTRETPSCKVGDKIVANGVKGMYRGAPDFKSAVIESTEAASVATPTEFETLTPLLADSLEHKYFATNVTIAGVTIVEYDSFNNPTVQDALGNKALCYKMELDPVVFPIGTKVSVTAVAGWYNGFRFVGDAKNIVIPVAGVVEDYTYPVRHEGRYTLTNNWVISNIEDNFAANKPGSKDYVRGMAAKDGIMYFINRETESLVRVDGETGKMLEPLKLQGEHLFEVQKKDGTWEVGVTYPFNDIKFDQAGNCLIGAAITGASKCQTFFIYIVDLETGVCTKLIEDVLWENPGLDQVQFRFDAFGAAGDVTKNGVVMAADANGSWKVYRWLITDGVAGEGEQVTVLLDPATDQSLFINVAGYGTAPQIFPQDEEGSLFYVDGFNTLPMLFYGNPEDGAMLIDDFIYVPTGTKVWNNAGDTISMSTQLNGLVEFQIGEEYFLLMVAANNTHNVPTTYALYKFADADRAFAGMEPLWYFPHNGLGTTTVGCRTAPVSVEVEGNTANIYLYTVNNGYASYTFNVPSKHTLTVKSNDSSMGTVSGSGVYEEGENIQIEATAHYGYHFSRWNDGVTDNPRSFVLTQDTTFAAFFAANHYQLNISTNNPDAGTVSGAGTYDYGTYTEISATANYGYYFSHWNDGNTQNPRVVKVTKDKTYTAYFEENTYNITKQYDAQQGSISGSTSGKYLDVISMTAIPNTGYHFSQWHDGVTDNPRSFVLTQDTTFAAFFAVNHYQLNISTNNPDAGTVSGAGTYEYGTYTEISATANYGYHFSHWNDGNTDNPHTVKVTGDKTYTAYFDNNTYSIYIDYDGAYGVVSYPTSGKYMDEINLKATPNLGYTFVGWSDGIKDNPRTIVLEGDIYLSANFTQAYSGQCGDNAYWKYDPTSQTISIMGFGEMYHYTPNTQPWILFKEKIRKVEIANDVTSLGTSAFAGCRSLGEVHIGHNLIDIYTNAFADCKRLYHVYCYPTYPPFADISSFANYTADLHIPCEYKEDYVRDEVWGKFSIKCLGAETEELPSGEVTTTTTNSSVTITWPTDESADTYTIEIKRGDQVFCTLTFSKEGQLMNIAFISGRDGQNRAQYAESTTQGLRFTITSLDSGTQYSYDITTRDENNDVIDSYTGEFTTQSDVTTNIDNVPSTNPRVQKILLNGQLYILREGKTYSVLGQEM